MSHLRAINTISQEKNSLKKQLLTSEIVADIINGVSKTDVFDKLQLGVYEFQEKPYKETSCYLWWKKAMERLHFSNEMEVSEKRSILWNRYEEVYKESMESGNLMNARATLDSMAKTFGLQDAEKKEIAVTDLKIDFQFGE